MQTIYLGLAVLMAVGLIGFGVGAGFGGGGVAEVFTKKEGGGTATFAAQVQKAEKQVSQHPQEAAAWQALAEARLHEASGSAYYDSTTESYTAKGKQELRAASKAWKRYLQLNPKSTPGALAEHMAIAYSAAALNEPAAAVQAMEIVIEDKPESAAAYARLAEFAYLAHNMQQGDLASKKAVSLVSKPKRPLLELEFEKMKKAAATASTSTAITPSSAGATGGAGATGTGSTPAKSGSSKK